MDEPQFIYLLTDILVVSSILLLLRLLRTFLDRFVWTEIFIHLG